jgi:hypothetical protein
MSQSAAADMDDTYSLGFEYISDTSAHDGRFWQLYAVEDAVIASAAIVNKTGNNFTSVPLKAGDNIMGVFTSVTLASGKVIAYKI